MERSDFLEEPLRDEKENFLAGAELPPNLELRSDLDLFMIVKVEGKEGCACRENGETKRTDEGIGCF